MFHKIYLVLALFPLLLISCSDRGTNMDDGGTGSQNSADQSQTYRTEPTSDGTSRNRPLPEGVKIEIVTPSYQKEWYESHPISSRAVASKSFELNQFTRTLEKTKLTLQVSPGTSASGAGPYQLWLLQAGKVVAFSTLNTNTSTANIKFSTPSLSDDDRKKGFAKLNYDLFIQSKDKRVEVPFSFVIYDASSPSLVLSNSESDCLIYHTPERASGCYQNRTRSTQEVVFNDSILQHHEVDVQFSGSLQLQVSVVTAQLGGSKTIADGTDTSRSSEIHFTNCIECASVIYRQQVDTIKSGDVYQVMADGSIEKMGSTVLTTSAFAYEFESTPSESQDYDCEIPSKLPVGSTPSCALH